jgi:hypothetical protein
MQGPKRERWEELCRQAAEEQDPKRLLALTLDINRLLLEKEDRVIATRRQGQKRISLATWKEPSDSFIRFPTP